MGGLREHKLENLYKRRELWMMVITEERETGMAEFLAKLWDEDKIIGSKRDTLFTFFGVIFLSIMVEICLSMCKDICICILKYARGITGYEDILMYT